jgi:NADPH-dependent F420 reductase
LRAKVKEDHIAVARITIVGSGNVGRALATSFVRGGHDVTVVSRSAEHAAAAAEAAGAAWAGSIVDAVDAAEIVVITVPFVGAAEQLAASIREASAGKIVIDVTNPARADYSGLVFDGSSSAAEQFAAWLPGARVVKAFNTVFASNQANPVVDGTRLDAFVAGDDADAKATVLDLARSAGFEPIDAGDLAVARLLEALAWLNISLNLRNPYGWRTGWKLVGTPVAVAA